MDPRALACVAALVLTLLYLYFFRSSSAPSAAGALAPSRVHAREALQAKGGVLLCGPSGSGKTTLCHQLVFSAAVRTVPSSSILAVQLSGAPGQGPLKLIDCPGAPRFRSQLLRLACECSAVVVVLSAEGTGEQVRGAAAVLYDLFTDAAVVAQAPRLLIVANKADLPGAQPLPALRAALERELQRLKATRAAVAAAAREGAEAPLLLGAPGVDFTFLAECPWAPPACVAAVSCTDPAAPTPTLLNLAGVRAFLEAA
jgi:signal recognition particle receptor subunit beta